MRKIFVSFLTALSICTFGQLLDTTETGLYQPITADWFLESDLTLLSIDSQSIDTSLLDFYHSYDYYTTNFPFIDLGLEGSSSLDISKSLIKKYGFNLGVTNFEHYFFTDDVKIYQTPKPYTRLNYSQGAKELVFIEVSHGQQISERLSFGLDYRRLKNQNLYYANVANQDRIRMNNLFNSRNYVGYYSKDRRYEMVASYLWNRTINVESGGIVSDSLFNVLSGRNKLENNPAFHSQAFGTQAQNSFKLSQYFRPQAADSANKSLNSFDYQGFLISRYDSRRIEYEDVSPDSAVYQAKFSTIHDSIHHRSISNEFGISLRTKFFSLVPSMRYAIDRVYFNGAVNTYNNVDINGAANFQLAKVKLLGDVSIGVLGYTQGNYNLKARLIVPVIEQFEIEGSFQSQLTSPGYLDQNFNSQIRNWDTSFTNSLQNSLLGIARYKKDNFIASISASIDNVNNPIYYASDSTAKQFNGNLSLLKTTLFQSYFGKWWGIRNEVTLQNSSNTLILPRPNFSSSSTVYTQFHLFKKALKLQVGGRLFYYSQFNAPSYVAYTRQWHNNISSEQLGNYPLVNAFLNAQIRTVHVGFNMYHVTESLFGEAFYSSDGYPMMPRSFRLNIRWDLLN